MTRPPLLIRLTPWRRLTPQCAIDGPSCPVEARRSRSVAARARPRSSRPGEFAPSLARRAAAFQKPTARGKRSKAYAHQKVGGRLRRKQRNCEARSVIRSAKPFNNDRGSRLVKRDSNDLGLKTRNREGESKLSRRRGPNRDESRSVRIQIRHVFDGCNRRPDRRQSCRRIDEIECESNSCAGAGKINRRGAID